MKYDLYVASFVTSKTLFKPESKYMIFVVYLLYIVDQIDGQIFLKVHTGFIILNGESITFCIFC
jgi:hypothetical protein